MDDFQMRRRILRMAVAGAASIGALPLVRADAPWPAKPIRLVIGFAAGGPTDVMTRVLGTYLGDTLRQPIVVENKPGASGNIGTADVVRSAPDGYSFLVAPTSMQSANPFLFKANFDPQRDLTPVSSFARTDLLLISRPNLGAASPADLVRMARDKPGRLSYASAGAGTPPHLLGELLNREARIDVTHVPYRGVAPALQDVITGQCDFMFDPGASFEYIKSGKVKLLGVASQKRSAFFPDAPTLIESGLGGVSLDITFGVWGPRGLPQTIVAQFNTALAKALAQPTVRERLAGLGAETMRPDPVSFAKFLSTETALLRGLIKDRNIKVD
jgi:tripartite-type tricarboxylate transporter receptor subunit TctC